MTTPEMDELLIGGLFEGTGGLTMGVRSVLGGRVLFHSEIEPAACKILEHHWPGVRNIGDITKADWHALAAEYRALTPGRERVIDVLTGGSPCQDVSTAGQRKGMRPGTRSGLWESMREAIAVLRPRLVVWENVRGVTSACAHSQLADCPRCVGGARAHKPVLRALGRVLGDLADLRFDAEWHGLPASGVGATHGRFREFVIAWDTDDEPAAALERLWRRACAESLRVGDPAADAGHHAGRAVLRGEPGRAQLTERSGQPDQRAAADPPDIGRKRRGQPRNGWAGSPVGGGRGAATTDADRARLQGHGPVSDGSQLADALGAAGLAVNTESVRRREGGAESARQFGGSDAVQRGERVVADADGEAGRRAQSRGIAPGPTQGVVAKAGRSAGRGRDAPPTADADRDALRQQPISQSERGDSPVTRRGGAAAADAEHGGRDGRPRDEIWQPVGRVAAPGGGRVDWGPYGPAIERWERVLGRVAPAPTELSARYAQMLQRRLRGEDRRPVGRRGSLRPVHRLSPAFVEWMMGLPSGHVTDPAIGIARNEQLKALGNGVVPQQAAAALVICLTRAVAA